MATSGTWPLQSWAHEERRGMRDVGHTERKQEESEMWWGFVVN